MPDEPRGPSKPQKGQGAKDSKLTKRNKNITSSLPDRNKERQLEADVNREMKDLQETIFEPWMQRVIELQSAGWSFERIIREGEKKRKETGTARPGYRKDVLLPSRKLLYTTLHDRPELAEECDKAQRFASDSFAQENRELADTLDEREGLKPFEWVQARHRRIRHRYHHAARLYPDKWGEQSTSEREVIVFEPYGGWQPTNTIKGAPAQGAEAEAAAERWRKIREAAKDA